jgi:hypothetical protein
MNICECGQPATEVCYRRGSAEEIWFCTGRKHTAKIRELAAQGWMSQSATAAGSSVGVMIRRRMQAA